MIKWNDAAYALFYYEDYVSIETKYQSYKRMLGKVNHFLDNPRFKNIYGTDFEINYLFNDDFRGKAYDFDRLLSLVRNKKVDKVFILSDIHDFIFYDIRELAETCKEHNVELMFPYNQICNVAYPELFNMYIKGIDKGDLYV